MLSCIHSWLWLTEWGTNDLHMVQLMSLPPIISCSSKIQNIDLPLCCQLTRIVLEKRPINGCSRSTMAHWCGNCSHRCKSGWDSGVMEGADPDGLVGGEGWGVQRWNRSLLPQKNELFHWNSIFWWILSGIFVHAVSVHCNTSNLVLEILKHGKTWGQFALTSPYSKCCGTCPDDLCPWLWYVCNERSLTEVWLFWDAVPLPCLEKSKVQDS